MIILPCLHFFFGNTYVTFVFLLAFFFYLIYAIFPWKG